MTRLNSAVTTFGIIVLLFGLRAEASEYADNVAPIFMNPDPSREVPWGQMSEDEMFFGAFTWKNY